MALLDSEPWSVTPKHPFQTSLVYFLKAKLQTISSFKDNLQDWGHFFFMQILHTQIALAVPRGLEHQPLLPPTGQGLSQLVRQGGWGAELHSNQMRRLLNTSEGPSRIPKLTQNLHRLLIGRKPCLVVRDMSSRILSAAIRKGSSAFPLNRNF